MPTNYLYIKILIWIFVGGLAFSKLSTRRHELVSGTKRERWSYGAALLFLLPLVYWCAVRSTSIGDTGSYRSVFINAPSSLSQLASYMAEQTKDAAFYGLVVVIKSLVTTNYKVYFGIIATIQLLCLGLVYRKYSRDYWLSIFLFVASTDYAAWMFNGMRQFLAAAIAFAALPFILQKKYIPSILIVFLASRFHQSALLVIPIIFIVQGKAWNVRTLLIALGSLIAVAFIDEFTGFLDSSLQDTQYENVVSDWNSWDDDGTNGIRVLVYSVPTIFAFIWRKKIWENDNPLIHLCVNMSIVSTAIYVVSMFTSGIFIGRLPIYCSLYNYILLPWEVRHFFKKESRLFITLSLILFYIAFYLYSNM